MNPNPKHVVIDMERGVLLRAPVWSSAKGARNWAATIALDVNSPGGLQRSWWKRSSGPGRYYYIPEGLPIGTPVEFGTNPSPSGARGALDRGGKGRRFYGYVLAIDPDAITFMKCADSREAVAFGAAVRSGLAQQRDAANKRHAAQRRRALLLDPDWNDP